MLFLIGKFFQRILYFRKDFRLSFYYFPLKVVDAKSPYTFEQKSSESNGGHTLIKEYETMNTSHTIPVHVPIPYKFPDRYNPLMLLATLHAFPNDYHKYLPKFDGENSIISKKHIQAFEDYLNFFEVVEEDVNIKLFVLSLQDKVKSWFKTLPKASISNLEQLLKLFLDRWIIKVNLLVIIEEYNQLSVKKTAK